MPKILAMCGGRGKRLNKLTEKTPKPLVRFRGCTIFRFKIEQYVTQGFDDFTFCIGFEGEKIRSAIADCPLDFTASFSEAGLEAGILNRFHYARDLYDDFVLMTYGDTLSGTPTAAERKKAASAV